MRVLLSKNKTMLILVISCTLIAQSVVGKSQSKKGLLAKESEPSLVEESSSQTLDSKANDPIEKSQVKDQKTPVIEG